jgi:hypothetical protein
MTRPIDAPTEVSGPVALIARLEAESGLEMFAWSH